jgi:hypothetical protein
MVIAYQSKIIKNAVFWRSFNQLNRYFAILEKSLVHNYHAVLVKKHELKLSGEIKLKRYNSNNRGGGGGGGDDDYGGECEGDGEGEEEDYDE